MMLHLYTSCITECPPQYFISYRAVFYHVHCVAVCGKMHRRRRFFTAFP